MLGVDVIRDQLHSGLLKLKKVRDSDQEMPTLFVHLVEQRT